MEPDIDLVADTDDYAEAIRTADRYRPQVAVFDAQLGDGHFTAMRRFHRAQRAIKIVALSGFELQPTAEQLDNMGSVAFLRKGVHVGHILEAVRRATGD